MNYPNDYINKIICGDCLEVMKGIPDKSIDLVLTSPPYNLGNNHHTGNKKTQCYDDDFPEIIYQETQIEILKECVRVLRDKGSILYNHKNRIKDGVMSTPYKWLFKVPCIIKQELVWFNGSQNFDKCRFYPMTERVYWLSKLIETDFINNINNHDLFQFKAEGSTGEHKRAFPLE